MPGRRTDHRGPEKTSAAQLAVYQQNYGAAALMVARGADVPNAIATAISCSIAAAVGGDAVLIKALLA